MGCEKTVNKRQGRRRFQTYVISTCNYHRRGKKYNYVPRLQVWRDIMLSVPLQPVTTGSAAGKHEKGTCTEKTPVIYAKELSHEPMTLVPLALVQHYCDASVTLLFLPLGSVRNSVWADSLSRCFALFSSKCGALMFLARTVTRYTVFGVRPAHQQYSIRYSYIRRVITVLHMNIPALSLSN